MRQSTLSIRRQWLPFGFAVEYNLALPLPPFSLPRLLDHCLRVLLPQDVYKETDILDYKGRDRLNLINPQISASAKPSGDELLYIEGIIYTDATLEEEPAKGEKENRQAFQIRLNTVFKEFEGNHHIRHYLRCERQGISSDALSIRHLGISVPLHITNFRLGLDFFESKFLSTTFGFAPTVSQTLLLESNENLLLLRISADGLKKRDSLPLSKLDMYEKLHRMLYFEMGFDFKADYSKRIA